MPDIRETPPPYEPTWAELRQPSCDQAWTRLAESANMSWLRSTSNETPAVDLLDLALYADLLTRAFGWDA